MKQKNNDFIVEKTKILISVGTIIAAFVIVLMTLLMIKVGIVVG